MNFKKYISVSKNEIPTDVVDISYDNSDTEQNIISTNEFSDEEISIVFEDEDSALEDNEVITDIENFEIPTIESEAEECLTDECFKTSQRILSSMDTSANPCENFFQFTCGNWMNDEIKARNPLLSDVFSEVSYSTRKGLIEVIESDYIVNESLSEKDQEYDKLNFEKMKNAYDSCLNVELVNSRGKEPLINFLNELNIYDYKERLNNPDGLSELLANLHYYYIDALFHISFTYYNGYFTPIIYSQSTVLNKKKFSNSTMVSYYKQYITDTLTNLFDSNERNIEAMTESIINIERKLANIIFDEFTDDEEDIHDILEVTTESTEEIINDILENKEKEIEGYNSIEDESNDNDKYYSIKSLNKKFPFINWKLYFNRGFELNNVDYSFDDESIIVTYISDYLKGLTNILLKLDTDSLLYYLEWVIINSRNHLISEEFYNIKKEFMNNIDEELYEAFEVEDSIKCLDKVNELVPLILGKYFVEKKFSDKTKETAEMLISKIVYHLNINTNSLKLPAGIFQSPIYGIGDPDYLVYGSLGSIIGHELTHAFDNMGRFYDAEGEITNWWSDASSSEFETLSECFVDQYNAYYLEDSQGNKFYVDGELGLGENIADNGGLARAYEAWRYSLENDPEDANERNKKLPGLSEYTLDQMFYIAFGQNWCGEYDDKIIREFGENSDTHTLLQNRVHGVLTNSAHFAKTFNCPLNSPMNPENKCLIW